MPEESVLPERKSTYDTQRSELIFPLSPSIMEDAVLGGEVAVPCHLQSALARLNPFPEAVRIVGSAFCT